MRSRPKLSAVALVGLEVIICLAIYFGCLYIRRRRQPNDEELSVPTRPNTEPGFGVIIFLPYSTLKGLLTPNVLQCAACLKEFNEDGHDEAETLRCVIMTKCGHVFHPTCVGNCGVFGPCPGCTAGLDRERDGEVAVRVEEELEERRCVVRLPEELRRRVTVQGEIGLAAGQPCLRTGYR